MKLENFDYGRELARLSNPLSDQIRAAFTRSGWTVYRLAKITRIAAPTLHRFLKGQSDLRLGTAWPVCQVLGLGPLTPGEILAFPQGEKRGRKAKKRSKSACTPD